MGGSKKRQIKFDIIDGCHICTSHYRDSGGYIHLTRQGKTTRAHRYLYQQKYGEIPDGMVVRHTCDNSSCININHLILGTTQDNISDRSKRGRTARGVRANKSNLTEKDVKDIYLMTGLSHVKIGEIYGVRGSSIWAIKNRKSWRHVTKDLDIKTE